MQKTKIEWTDYSWNPIKGACPNKCWYCYGRRMYQRFGWDSKPSIPWRTWCSDVAKIQSLRKPNKIFVCSTFELFHPSVKEEDRDSIFNVIKGNSQHTFQILTKFPQNIDRPMPDNVWLGLTLTGTEKYGGLEELKHFEYKVESKMKFVSHEPLLCDPMINIAFVDWIIVGKLTGYGKKHDPPKEWIENIVMSAKRNNAPIFLKDNLKDIWGEPLSQEFPHVV